MTTTVLGESVISDLMYVCRTNQVPCVTVQTRELLMKYLNEYQPKHYVEIGSARGVSLYTAHQCVSQRGGTVIGVERSLPNVVRIQQTIQQYGLEHIAIYHRNASVGGWDQLLDYSIDFALIDAAKAQYHIYLQTLLPHMAPGSIIICDDVIEFRHKLHHLYQFLDENQMNYELIPLGDGDGVLVIKM